MKVPLFKSLLLLIFAPKKLEHLAIRHGKYLNQPEVIEEKQRRERETPLEHRSIRRIRRNLLTSFCIVAISMLAGFVAGRLYIELVGTATVFNAELLQYVGIGILLWATLGKLGWSIQTMDGGTVPELVNEWIFRALYVVGSFALALSASLAFG